MEVAKHTERSSEMKEHLLLSQHKLYTRVDVLNKNVTKKVMSHLIG